MLMFSKLKSMLFGEAATPLMVLPQPLPVAANDAAAEGAPIDWVESANRTLTAALNRLPVKRLAPNGEQLPALMPVAAVELGGFEHKLGGPIFVGGPASSPHAQLTIKLRDAVGNYNIDSLNNAIHLLIGGIPGLAGHVKFAKDVKEQSKNYGDIWQELQPILQQSGKFNDQEWKLIGAFFKNDPKVSEDFGGFDPIRVDHAEGKLQVRFETKAIKGDENEIASADARIIEYFNEHRQQILSAFKGKLVAAGIDEQALASLDFNIGMQKQDWRNLISMEIGSLDKDGKLQKTVLEGIDTDKLDAMLSQAIFEGEEVPYIFPRIADGEAIGHLLRNRLGTNNEALEKVLDHDMFKSHKQKTDERTADSMADIATIQNAIETDNPHELKIDLPLPQGVSLETLRAGIVANQHQLLLTAQSPAAQGLAA